MNPSNETHLGRLYRAVEWSRRKLEVFRRERFAAVRQYVGSHYGEGGSSQRVPVNLVYLAASIYLRQLAARAPRVMISTRYGQLKPLAYDMEIWANDRVRTMGLEWTLRRIVLDAMFCLGIAKVGLTTSAQVRFEGWTHLYGEPYVDWVDLDDWCHDMTARRWDQVAFCGNLYRMPLEALRLDDTFTPDAVADLKPTERRRTNEDGDERIETISQGDDTGAEEEYTDYMDLWDLWLPRERVLLTCPCDDAGGMGPPIRVQEWTGPEHGPFHLLSFTEVPGQIMPTAPVQQLIDLHELTNVLFRKLGRQAERQKTMTGFPGMSEDDARRITNASDGEAVRLDNPGQVQEFRHGGIDQHNLMFMVHCKDLFTYLAGNLDSLGGLSPQAETLGQDQMLQANASKLVQEMQDRTINFTQTLMRDLCWYWWTDPVQSYEIEKPLPGNQGSMPVSVTPDRRQSARFVDLNFEISPYSMQHQSPSVKLQGLMNLTNMLMQAGPMMQQQGVAIDWAALVRKIAHYTAQPDLEEIIAFQSPPPEGGGPYEEAPRKPPMTNRVYTRVNKPSASPQQQNTNQMMQMMQAAGGGQNGRPSGGATGA